LNASVELARAIASMHTILRTGPVIASGLDDQRFALGDWRSGPASAMVRPRHARDDECRSTICPRLLCSAAHRTRLKAKRSTAHHNEVRPMAVLNKLMAPGIVPPEVHGVLDTTSRRSSSRPTCSTSTRPPQRDRGRVRRRCRRARGGLGTSPAGVGPAHHADLAPIWSRTPRRRCCAGPAPRRSSPTCGVTSSDSGWLRGRRLRSRRAAPVGTGCGRQRGALRGHRCAPTSHVVQEAGGQVAGPGEAGFVGTQRHGRGP
jgi:hypothetical protein